MHIHSFHFLSTAICIYIYKYININTNMNINTLNIYRAYDAAAIKNNHLRKGSFGNRPKLMLNFHMDNNSNNNNSSNNNNNNNNNNSNNNNTTVHNTAASKAKQSGRHPRSSSNSSSSSSSSSSTTSISVPRRSQYQIDARTAARVAANHARNLYKGVTACKSGNGRYMVQIRYDGSNHHVGYYNDAVAAAKAYDDAARANQNGGNCGICVNFPVPGSFLIFDKFYYSFVVFYYGLLV